MRMAKRPCRREFVRALLRLHVRTPAPDCTHTRADLVLDFPLPPPVLAAEHMRVALAEDLEETARCVDNRCVFVADNVRRAGKGKGSRGGEG